ncbi:MAG: hypothetical protein Q9210_004641 [Variospora velana]
MMNSFGDEDDADSGAVSLNGSSDNDHDGQLDGEGDAEAYTYGDAENDDEDNEEGDDEHEQDGSQDPFGDPRHRDQSKNSTTSSTSSGRNMTGPAQDRRPSTSAGLTSHPNPTVLLTSASPTHTPPAHESLAPRSWQIRSEALTASTYDIVPTIAAPHSTSINSITATPDLRWVFSGGADGYIRKFNWIETVNGKSMLTVAQRHPFVDSVTKAGVLLSYWENEDSQVKVSTGEEGPYLSSVYSLAVQRDGLWLLSGLENGGINVQSIRHDEGKQIACLRQHTSAISVLNLAEDEQSVLSGSWDKAVIDWDLNTGKVKRKFEGSGGQISTLESRPTSALPVPETSGDALPTSDTFSGNGADKPLSNGILTNGSDQETKGEGNDGNGVVDAPGSPADSLFGGNDSLFGDDDAEGAAPSAGNFIDDDDDEFSRAIANGISEQENVEAEGEADMAESAPIEGPPPNGSMDAALPPINGSVSVSADGIEPSTSMINGLPHAEDTSLGNPGADVLPTTDETESSHFTFLAASFDGSLRIWDKRRPSPIARIPPRNVPPWCMNACWSPDGNFVYAGRRNGTVEEFSLHKGLRGVERIFKLPNGSGPVSAVRAMPNGRHLICASYDILRLYDLEQQQTFKHSTVPFLIVPGHRTGVVSHLYIDPTCRQQMNFTQPPTHIIVSTHSDPIARQRLASLNMPQLRNVTVHVTDEEGNDLEEWGVQSLRGSKVSAYIKSTPDTPFKISVRPEIPYSDERQLLRDSHHRASRRGFDGIRIKQEESEADIDELAPDTRPADLYRPSAERHLRSADSDSDRRSRRPRRRGEHTSSSSTHGTRRASYKNRVPRFSFLATLYIDGRKKPERRLVVYLDPSDSDFSHPDGLITFNHRSVQTRDGRVKHEAWVFKDIGIETIFKGLAVGDGTKDIEDSDEFLINAMNTSRLGGRHSEVTQEHGKVGQIVVELERIRLGKRFRDANYQSRTKHHDGDHEDVNMEGLGQDVAHQTAHKHVKTLEAHPTRCIEFEAYRRGEGLWATFQFFYRSQEQLDKFNFPGFPQIPQASKKVHRSRRLLDTKLAMLTPLSIARAPQKSPTSTKGTAPTFEERVRQGSGDLQRSEYNFLDYRDPSDNVPAFPKDPEDHAAPTAVVAVKEKARRRSYAGFPIVASRSGSLSPIPSDSSPITPHAPSAEAPANSPETGSLNPFADPQLCAPKGSALDMFKTLSDASLALIKAGGPAMDGRFTPSYSIKNPQYRQADPYSDADDERDGLEDAIPTISDDEESAESDKENKVPMDREDGGLHKQLKAISLGTKRYRGEGTEELKESEAPEEERQAKKVTSPGDKAILNITEIQNSIK